MAVIKSQIANKTPTELVDQSVGVAYAIKNEGRFPVRITVADSVPEASTQARITIRGGEWARALAESGEKIYIWTSLVNSPVAYSRTT